MSRFVRLCEISSPTGEEAEIAAAVKAELESFGLEVSEDDAAGPAGAGAGNLLVRVEGEKPGFVLFAAHIDTVPHSGPIEVVLDDEGVYRSGGDTILGADNKAAVAVLMELASRYSTRPPPIGIELLFTVAEEQGLRGAAAFDVSRLESKTGFVFDHATDIGEVITASPSLHRITAEFTGVEAHAGLVPEAGRSAIVTAAAAIGEMKLGRVDEETTANIGRIEGGSSGNIIPGSCLVSGEVRSIDPDKVTDRIAEMSDAMVWAASANGCEVDIVTEEIFRGYLTPDDSPALIAAEEALRARGHEPVRRATGGGSDANVFMAAGIDVLLLANGTYDNHTHEESVPRDNLVEMLEICEEILKASAARC
ncbi:MAG: M20/M25/M40 family metallo-hydrolase [Solirubrobacterales bacterium]|nr:M20/M25/M40 family metallo-hydrolase [Solirubrobacterales bacterium]